MNSSIYIDGIALYVFIIFLAIAAIGIILLGCSFCDDQRTIQQLKAQNRRLKQEVSEYQATIYKSEFRKCLAEVANNDTSTS